MAGRGCARLGLEGTARQEDFEAVCDNINPTTRPPDRQDDRWPARRLGFEFQFQKSVGLAREIIGLL